MVALDGQPEARVQVSRELIAFVLIDGLADIQIPDMANLTPLEAADTPTMDAVSGRKRCCKTLQTNHQMAAWPAAASGLNGLLDPVEPGLACGSDTAHMSILGYDPRL